MQNLKVSRKPLEVASLEKTAQAKLNSRTIAKRIVTCPILPQFFRYCVALLVLGATFANCIVTYAIHIRDKITDAVGVDRITELRLGRVFVAFGNCDLAHVVVKADELRALPIGPRTSHAHPRSDAVLYLFIRPVAHHHFAIEPQPRVDESRFPVTMRSLV